MANTKKKRRDRIANRLEAESRAAEALTVAWMLAMLATLLAECGALLTWALAAFVFGAGEGFHPLASLPGLLLFMAVICGVVCLILGPVAHRLRRTPAPRSVSLFAMLVGMLPLLTLLAFLLLVPRR